MRRYSVTKPAYHIVPKYEPQNDGIYRECMDARASVFFVEMRGQAIQGFDTRAEAQDFIDQRRR